MFKEKFVQLNVVQLVLNELKEFKKLNKSDKLFRVGISSVFCVGIVFNEKLLVSNLNPEYAMLLLVGVAAPFLEEVARKIAVIVDVGLEFTSIFVLIEIGNSVPVFISFITNPNVSLLYVIPLLIIAKLLSIIMHFTALYLQAKDKRGLIGLLKAVSIHLMLNWFSIFLMSVSGVI